MRNLTLKFTGLAIAATLCATITPSVSTYAANVQQSNIGIAQTLNTKAVEYGWVTTHDGVGVVLRKSTSTSSARLDAIPEGTKVKILSILSNWYKVTYNGKTGYVARGYLVDKYGDAI